MARIELEDLNQVMPNATQNIRTRIYSILSSDDFHGVISATEAAQLALELDITLPQLMLMFTQIAAFWAIVPISNFRVGAIAQGLSGNLYFGSNVEYAGEALSFGSHGEQSATVNAWANGETGMKALAITAAPCGYCRQFLYETTTASEMGVSFYQDTDPVTEEYSTLVNLLPYPFGPQNLNIPDRLMEARENHGLVLNIPTADPTVSAALAAANWSYSPYTKDYSGVALKTSTVTIVGPYAENAAYNPSLSPMEVALTLLNQYDVRFCDIQEAVLVESQNSSCSQVDAATAALKSATVGKVTLNVQYAQ